MKREKERGIGRIERWLALALALSAVPARSARIHNGAGTTSATFLKIGVGARPVGMGEAFTAVSGDPHGVLWNPASVAALGSQSFAGTHNESFAGIRNDFAVYARPLPPTAGGRRRALAAHVLTLVPPGQERRSGVGENDPFNPLTQPEGSFGAHDVALGLSYGQEWGRSWTLGGTFNVIRQSIAGVSAHTFSVNLGVLRETAIPGLRLGAALLHMGPGISFGRTFKLPFTYRVGAFYAPRRDLHLVADLSKSIDDFPFLSFGGEFDVFGPLTLRAGYRWRTVGNALGAFSGARFGAGLRFAQLRLDYAFAPFGELGKGHRISISIPWGGARQPKMAKSPRPLPRLPPADAPSLPAPRPIRPALNAPAGAGDSAPGVQRDAGGGRGVDPAGTGNFPVRMRPRGIVPRGMVFDVAASAISPEPALRSLRFRAILRSTQSVRFEVAEEPNPAEFDVLPSTYAVYRLLRIRRDFQAQLRGVAMGFEVEKAWLRDENVAPDRVVLFRIEDEKVLQQQTFLKGAEGTRLRYEGHLDHLGEYWLIAGGHPEPKSAPTPEPETPAPEAAEPRIRPELETPAPGAAEPRIRPEEGNRSRSSTEAPLPGLPFDGGGR